MLNEIYEVSNFNLIQNCYRGDVNYIEVGGRIKVERERFEMSRKKLSEILEISIYFLGQIERGEKKMSLDTLINVSRCLRISTDYLLYGQVNSDTNNNFLHLLNNKCSEKEIKVIEDMIKLILPHLAR